MPEAILGWVLYSAQRFTTENMDKGYGYDTAAY
jgi:hypothetical protein